MVTKSTSKSHKNLFINTLAFTICFSAWVLNGVLVTFLVSNQLFNWSVVEVGWLMGIPILAGAVFRLPAGILTDKFGGKPIFVGLLLLCSIPMFLLSYSQSFFNFALCSFGFGLVGASFSIGIAATSLWFPKQNQGTALGIFGAGNAGAALTTFLVPTLLINLTQDGIENWRILPKLFAAILVGMAIIYSISADNKKIESNNKTLASMLKPLKNTRVWRFGLYYFLVFGCFVAFSQWLVPYFVNVYYLPLVTAGILASLFSFPSGIIRALGGWMSDRMGARRVMYWVLGVSVAISFMLIIPKMEIYSPGQGIMAKADGVVTNISKTDIVVDDMYYHYVRKPEVLKVYSDKMLVFPTKEIWQEPNVKVGQKINRKMLLAKGVTKIFFQANVWIFAVLVIILGSVWGVGKAAVYKLIPDYFPDQVGVVGGMVGVLGGLGGFFCPIIFGYLLDTTGLWTSCWMFMFLISVICLLWLNKAATNVMKKKYPNYKNLIDDSDK